MEVGGKQIRHFKGYVFIMIGLAVVLWSLGHALAQSQLLHNGGFETAGDYGMPEGWSLWTAEGAPQAALDSSTAYEGQHSLRIHADTTTRAAVGQVISGIEENTTYEISFAVKTRDLRSSSRGAVVRVQFLSGTTYMDASTQQMIGELKGDQDWTKLQHTFQTPAGATGAQVQMFLWSGTGTVWYDDVSLVRVDTSEPQDPDDGLIAVPKGEEIVALLKERYPNQQHPRILATEADFASMRERAANDPLVHEWYLHLKEEVFASFSEPLPTYEIPDGYRLLETSRRVLRDIQRLGILYQIEQDSLYAERAWEILEGAGSFPDWNPQHFLDVAEMTNAFAIGYDWFYEAWTEEQKHFLVQSIRDMGLIPAVQVYRGEVQGEFGRSGWITATTNWNTVVNGGMAMGALAVADVDDDLAAISADVLEGGLHSIQRVLPMFEPDGAGEEGVGYWAYNANYLVYYLATLTSALGTDYGISELPGIRETAYFPIFLGGPKGAFNYGNNSASFTQTPSFFWLANRFADPDIAWYQRSLAGSRGSALDILWYDPQHVSEVVNFDLDRYFSKVNSGSMRSAWEDDYALFLGFKGGNNAWNHNHLDLGTFVLDALGIRWAMDLGADDYNLPEYFGAGRVNYYRIRTEGQNTLVLNPSIGPGQKTNGKADIIRAESSPDQAFLIADLTDGYADDALDVKRGVMLANQRREVIVQDEITMKAPGDIYWFMHTAADIEVIEDGKAALLMEGGKRLFAQILTPGQVTFQVRDAKPLPTSPDPEGQAVNVLRKLAVFSEETAELQLAIRFVPLLPWEDVPNDRPAVIDLEDWQTSHADLPLLSAITVDGEPLAGFRADTFTYHIPVSSEAQVPVIGAEAAELSDIVQVIPAAEVPGTAVIRVQHAADAANVSEYRIHFLTSDQDSNEVVTASSHDGNVPSNTLDGNLNTRWSAEGDGQWIQYRLDQERVIDYVDIAFYNGDRRSTFFDIQVSLNGEDWTTVYSGQSSGSTVELERFPFDPSPARFVRIVGYGNTVNAWNSITEVFIEGLPIAERPVRLAKVTLVAAKETVTIGESFPLQWSAKLSDGSIVTPGDGVHVRYISSDPAVISVDEEGLLTGVAVGTARIGIEVMVDGYVKTDVLSMEATDGSLRLSPVADTFVRGGVFSQDNYGRSASLTVKGDRNPDYAREALMRFDLSGVEGEIESAVLRLYAGVNDTAGTETVLSAFSINGAWEENTVTWETKPDPETWLASEPVESGSRWVELDLTSFAQERHLSGEPVEIALIHAPEHPALATNIHSREHSTNKPYLRVKVKEPSGPPVTSAVLTPSEPNGDNGWYTDQVSLALEVEDSSGATATTEYRIALADEWQPWFVYQEPLVFAEDGEYIIQYYSQYVPGEAEEIKELQLRIDTSAPTVTDSVYESFEPVESLILSRLLTVTDAVSGVDESRMTVTLDGETVDIGQPIPLYTLHPGKHIIRVTVYDMAGNRAEGAAEFTVVSSYESLQRLVAEFRSLGWIHNDGIARSLIAQLEAESLNSFVRHVRSVSGKQMTEEAATLLLRFAAALVSTYMEDR